jgi:hypothetical protein
VFRKSRCMVCQQVSEPALGNVYNRTRWGCRWCASRGIDYCAPALVYLITHPQLGAHKIGICNTGCLDRCPDDVDAFAVKDPVEGVGEPRVSVADQELELRRSSCDIHRQIAGLLSDPVACGVLGDTENGGCGRR